MIKKCVIKWLSKSVFNFQDDSNKKLFRILEKLSKKFISTELHLLFNEICLNENLLPRYTDFKLHDAVARNERFVQDCRKQLISRQIDEQKKLIEELIPQISTSKQELRENTPSSIKFEALEMF